MKKKVGVKKKPRPPAKTRYTPRRDNKSHEHSQQKSSKLTPLLQLKAEVHRLQKTAKRVEWERQEKMRFGAAVHERPRHRLATMVAWHNLQANLAHDPATKELHLAYGAVLDNQHTLAVHAPPGPKLELARIRRKYESEDRAIRQERSHFMFLIERLDAPGHQAELSDQLGAFESQVGADI
jgi:hypothetical protein